MVKEGESPTDEQREAIETAHARFDPAKVDRTAATADRLGHTLIMRGHEHWPAQLADLNAGQPIALWVAGNPALLGNDQHRTVIEGARACTSYGQQVASQYTSAHAANGHTLISGGAFGIGAEALRSALAEGAPSIAVMAGGLDRYYPSAHQELLERVAHTGAVIAEVSHGTPPSRWRFLGRNRIVAALADTMIVVEAGRRSGALFTAGWASMLARNTYAVPGPILSEASAGCHRLIREGTAHITTSAEDTLPTAPQ